MTTVPVRAPSALPTRRFALEIEVPTSAAVWPAVTIAIEGAGFHLLFASSSPAIAWTLTGVNCVALLGLWRAYRAIGRARLIVTGTHVEVRAWSGFRCRFPRSLVERVEATTWESMPDSASDLIHVSGQLEPNVIVVLRQATEVRVVPGIHKAVSRIAMRVTDAGGALALLR